MTHEEAFPSKKGLRVAVVHSFYSSRQTSGENKVVEQQTAALTRAGFAVMLFAQHTDRRERLKGLYPLEAGATVATGRGRSPLRDLHEWRPDVVHVHNLFPNFGRTWVNKWEGPIVATTHNYRPLCPAGTFYRDGHMCTDCLDQRSARPAVQHGCYRGSRVQTLPLAASTRFGDDPLLRRADRVMVLNETMRGHYVRAGVDPERIAVLGNFLPDPPSPGEGGGPWLYVGRLSEEKGIRELVAEWPADRRLLVVGDGPLREQVTALAPTSVTFLGTQPSEAVSHLMRAAVGLVFPSRCLEGFPLVYLEALAAGTPLLAWRPSVVADFVVQHGTGVVANNLPADLAAAEVNFPQLRGRCRMVFDDLFTERAWTTSIDKVYAAAVATFHQRAGLASKIVD